MKVKAEKNFKRARSKPAKRWRVGNLLSWRLAGGALVAIVVVYAGYRAIDLGVNAAGLHITKIDVTGNVRLSKGEVQALVRDLRGTNILTADLGKSRRTLLRSPWVSEVALRRVLPSTIEVHVSERRPFGVCRLGNQLYLIDRDGTVMDEFGPRYAEFDLPIVDGLVNTPRSGKPSIDEDRAELAARVVDAIQESSQLKNRVSQIDVSDLHDAVVLLDNDTALLHVGDERFRERLQSYLEIAGALRERIPDIDYVDLRFDQRVYVKPRGRAGALHLETAGKTF
jgi:cell division septal protein FtsQ